MCNMVAWHCGTMAWGTMALCSYHGTMVAWQHDTVAGWHHVTNMLLHCGLVALWHCGTMHGIIAGKNHCPTAHGTVAPWQCGTMVPWHHCNVHGIIAPWHHSSIASWKHYHYSTLAREIMERFQVHWWCYIVRRDGTVSFQKLPKNTTLSERI